MATLYCGLVRTTLTVEFGDSTEMRRTFAIFILLQLLDCATTLIAFSLGGTESNPFVARFLDLGPIWGLLLSKLIVVALAGLGASLGKERGIRVANFAFALVLAWNVSIGRLAARI